jgi:predicted flavoprotein YhiN
MHVINNYNQKTTLNNGANQKSLSIGGVEQTQSRQQTITTNAVPERVYAQNQAVAAKDKRAQSLGQNMKEKPKDAFTLIQEQQRAEQAKQPQNQFEHQENILKQLNSDEVYNKLMKIFNEREQLYD